MNTKVFNRLTDKQFKELDYDSKGKNLIADVFFEMKWTAITMQSLQNELLFKTTDSNVTLKQAIASAKSNLVSLNNTIEELQNHIG